MRRILTIVLLVLLPTVGCDSTADPGGGGDIDADTTLAGLAARHGLLFGAGLDAGRLTAGGDYTRIAGGQFSVITAGNAMKFGPLRPTRSAFAFANADRLVDFAEQNGQEVRGHTLIWHSQLPQWVTNGTWTRSELIDVMAEHIGAVVERYRGRVYAWDVVNEPFEEDGSLRETIFLDVIGPDYIALAFHMAHTADPDAILYLNEYNAEGSGPKSDAVYALAQDLLADGVPIHGIGMQMHFTLDWHPTSQQLASNMRRLNDLGLAVDITELDVRILMPATSQELAQQAVVYRTMLDTCLLADDCPAFTIWGFTDRHSWVPGTFQGYGAALPWDEDYRPKPAYWAMRAALED